MRHILSIGLISVSLPVLGLQLLSCQSSSIPSRETQGEFTARSGERAAVFTFLVRGVSVTRSQGIPWYIKLSDEEAAGLYRDFSLVLKDSGFSPVEPRMVRDLDIVRGGRFTLREEFHINPEYLPIVKSKQDEELMMRTSRALDADLYFVVLADHSVSRVLLRPASVSATIQVIAYRASTGQPVFSSVVQKSAQALPYELDAAGGDFQTRYREVMRKTALDLLGQAVRSSAETIKQRLRLLPGAPADQKKTGPIEI